MVETLLALSLAGAAVGVVPSVELVAFQRTWLQADGSIATPFSNHGELGVTPLVPGGGSTPWFNAAIEGVWAIRNVLLPGSAEPAPTTAWVRFALPLPGGDWFGKPVDSIFVEWTLTEVPLAEFTWGFPTPLPVGQSTYFGGLDQAEPPDPPPPAPAPIEPQPAPESPRPTGDVVDRAGRDGVPGVSEGVSRCAPGAAARCLAWLAGVCRLSLPPGCRTPQEIYAKLDTLMGQTAIGGTAGFGLHGLKAFLELKGLAGQVTFEKRRFDDPAPPGVDDLVAAMKRGYDVILLFGWWKTGADGALERSHGHQGTAVEIVCRTDGYQIWYRDDTEPGAGQGDGQPDKGLRKATLQKQTLRDGTQSWWVPEEGVDPATGVARTYRWEGMIQVCPARLTLSRALDGWAEEGIDVAGGIDDPAAPTGKQRDALKKAVTHVALVACWLHERVAGESAWPPGCAEIVARMKEKALAAKATMESYLAAPSAALLAELTAQLLAIRLQETDLRFLVDCDLDGVSDEIQILQDPSLDADGDGVLDACEEPPSDPADLDGDGFVDGADLGLLLSLWGSGDLAADLDGDGVVGGADLGLLLSAWSP